MASILYFGKTTSLIDYLQDPKGAKTYAVDNVRNFEDAHRLALNFCYDIVLVDWSLTGKAGLDFCAKYRLDGGEAWIVVLNGSNDFVDLEDAFQAGADDYLAESFSIRELTARLKAGLRRMSKSYKPILLLGDVCLDTQMNTLHANGIDLHLMPKESELLAFLIRNLNRGFSSKQLLLAVWSSDTRASEGIVRTYIRQIRKKLETIGRKNLITSLIGGGYMVPSLQGPTKAQTLPQISDSFVPPVQFTTVAPH